MHDKLDVLFKNKPLIISNYLFYNYKKLKITEEEFVFLIYLLNEPNPIILNQVFIGELLDITPIKVMELVYSLKEKNILELKIIKNSNKMIEEYIYMDLFYEKIKLLFLNEDSTKNVSNDFYKMFEREFGRLITPMEYETINNWLNKGYEKDIIKEALKEAVLNGVGNLKYMDRILSDWKLKNIKTVNDVKNRKVVRKTTEKKEVIETGNWLEDF